MYRKSVFEQAKIEMPFGVELDPENRWVKLAGIMPWEKIEEKYSQKFESASGNEAYSSRLAFGALYIQGRLKLTDEETVNQIQETPSMQYFCGFEWYTVLKPFDSSLMVHFRKRLTAELIQAIAEEAFASETKKAIEKDKDNDDENGSTGASGPNKGKLFLDATCCPSDIHFPTDVGLLNHARELTEVIIDGLYEQICKLLGEKPRTYRIVARQAFMAYVKLRKRSYAQIRFAIKQQLAYVRRNLETIAELIALGANMELLGSVFEEKLATITKVYSQQKEMYDEQKNSIEERIVSIEQPHLRPIVRGKSNAPVEFGAKVATVHIGGFSFVVHMSYDNFSEAKYLKASVEKFKRMFGFYPATVVGDKAYMTNDNRNYCKSLGIRLSAPKKGRKSETEKAEEKKQLYKDNCERNAVEGDYGTVKRKYGLDRMMTKLFDTTLTAISFGFFIKNMERVLRFFVGLFSHILVCFGRACPPRLKCFG